MRLPFFIFIFDKIYIFQYILKNIRFEWDKHKAGNNFKKHKINFEMAITVFDDPYALIALDEKHSTAKEKREWIIGESDNGILVVVFTKRIQGAIYR